MANRTIIPNTHSAIIDETTFEKANSMLRTNTKTNRLKDYKGTLDGLVRCGECGKPLNVSGRKKAEELYINFIAPMARITIRDVLTQKLFSQIG